MHPRSLSLAVALMTGTLVACGPTARLEVPVTHPGNPAAAETPAPERSNTLASSPHLQAVPPLPKPASGGEREHHHDHGTKPKDP